MLVWIFYKCFKNDGLEAYVLSNLNPKLIELELSVNVCSKEKKVDKHMKKKMVFIKVSITRAVYTTRAVYITRAVYSKYSLQIDSE